MATITLRPTAKQHLAYEALKTKSKVFLGGGAGGGKSWFICESRLVNCYRFPGYKSFIGREELKRLMQSTYITWLKVCSKHKIPKNDWNLNGQYNYIQFNNGSRVDLLDLKYLPSDPLYERFGSLEYTDGAIEEAGEVDFLAYDVLKSRIGRHNNRDFGLNPTILITGNPKKNWTYREFYKPWKNNELPDDYAFIQSLYGDNPWTAEDYGKQLRDIKDKSMKQRLMFGNWEYEDDINTLVNYDAIVDLFTNTVEESEEKYFVADLARYGGDKIVYSWWKGLMCYRIEFREKQGLDTTEEEIRNILAKDRIPYSHALVDEGGLGGGVVDNLRGIKGFVGNATPLPVKGQNENINPAQSYRNKLQITENYRNLKSQCGFLLADNINNHKIAIQCEDAKIREDIINELEYLKAKDIETEGKHELKPKEEIKEELGRSPDYLDTFIMRMFFELTLLKSVKPNKFLNKPIIYQ